ncbi:part of a binding-protein-dependent transport system [Arthrobacter sp. Hiyo1]|nr:part of a binding-protein-dependent transport system [Arthrobacter sp. Hiyo1]
MSTDSLTAGKSTRRKSSRAAKPDPQSPNDTSRRRKGLSERNRPLWMLIPGGLLMVIIIVVPLLLGIFMSGLDLDQYSLRKWVSAPFIGVQNFVEALTASPLLHAIWLSVSYSLLAMVVTIPLGIAGQSPPRTRSRAGQ